MEHLERYLTGALHSYVVLSASGKRLKQKPFMSACVYIVISEYAFVLLYYWVSVYVYDVFVYMFVYFLFVWQCLW